MIEMIKQVDCKMAKMVGCKLRAGLQMTRNRTLLASRGAAYKFQIKIYMETFLSPKARMKICRPDKILSLHPEWCPDM